MTIAEQIVKQAGGNPNLVVKYSEEVYVYDEQDLKEGKTFYWFWDNSGVIIQGNEVKTF